MITIQKFYSALFNISSLEKQKFISLLQTELLTYGFKKVTKVFGGKRKYYKAIRFEKLLNNGTGQWIEFVFEKYGARRFYIIAGISETLPPNQHILVGHIIRHRNQTQYWWGVKWYSILRQRVWRKTTRRIPLLVPQIVSYLDVVKTGKTVHHYIEVD